MAAKKHRSPVPKTLYHGIGFLDPTDCGSTVGFRIVDNDYDIPNISATIQLTDCNKMIVWYMECDAQGLKKIENAIDLLTNARNALQSGIHAKERMNNKRK